MADIARLIEECSEWITPELESCFTVKQQEDITVKAAMYSLMGGGKRLRPLMMKMTAEMLGCSEDEMADVRYFAATLEMIHTYSLIHDDLPAMDNDDLRRGRPTCHKAFGEGIALLAGDLLLNSAYERLFAKTISNPGYAYASGRMCTLAGIEGMVGGQSIDLASEDKKISMELLTELQEKKTGALIETAIVTPCYLKGNMTEEQAESDKTVRLLRQLAAHLGLAFQIKDDLLDVTSTAEVLGKSVGKDSRDDKSTFVTLLGLEQAKVCLEDETAAAVKVLKELSDMGYNTEDYRILADYMISREN
ncbi:MAG: polyprenyl synthetase family protein [Clostridiales bacterium]|nr:polyprenyl synthetase family protein [Clostridiales bacterium]